MPMTRYKPGQIVTLLRQIEVATANGKSTRQACKEVQITAQTYYRWRKEYGFRKHHCVRGRVDLGHAQACGTEVVRGDQPASLFVEKGQELKHVRYTLLVGATLLLLPCLPAHAQTSTTEFFPEIDTYFKPTSNARIVFQAKETREGGDPTQAELGPSVEFYLKPLLKLHDVTVFDLDDSKSRLVVLSVGYRYVPSPDKPTVNRLEPVATFHFPMKGRILISDRNRFDLDWSNGSFTWRYRNRLTVERRGTIRSYHPGPYVSAEVYYESQYSKWSTTALYAGCLLPVGKHVQIDPYYEHENNTGKRPNQQVNAAGLILNLYF